MEISGTVLKNIPAFLPDKKELKKFQEVCRPVFITQMQNELEIGRLSEMQSILLSQLSTH